MAESSEDVLPTLRDFFNSKKPGEEDEFMFYRVHNSSCNSIPPRPTKPGNKTKERHGFFNQGTKERSRRNVSNAERFSVEQYASSGFFGVRLNTNGRQHQQRSSKPLGSGRNMEPRLQKSFSARIQLPFMASAKGSNQSNSSSSTSWFSRIKKMSNPFSNRNPLIPKPGEIKVSGGGSFSRNMSFRESSPVHLHAHLRLEYELGMPVFTFLLDHSNDVYVARTWMDDNDSRFGYSFRYIGGKSNKNLSGIESSLIGQMQVSTQIYLEPEPYEDPVESTVSEFVLFDIARARRSGLQQEKLSRQNSFRRGSDRSSENRGSNGSNDLNLRQENLQRQNSFSRGLIRNLSKHSENSASDDPWTVSDLHPGLEIAAIVIRDSSSICSESFEYMKNSKVSRREINVIVPTGSHGLPENESSCPTPILQRWRSGGGCDCNGWDMGCELFVLEETQLTNHQPLELFIEGGKENTPAMTMEFVTEGHYEVNFHAKLSALQAFSVCVAELHTTVTSRGERSNSLSRCSSLRELIDMETPVNGEVLSSFMPNVTFSPISRV